MSAAGRRILIATVTAGSGHVQAAVALEEAWRRLAPGDTVERVDVLDWASRLQRKLYVDGLVKVVSHAPELHAFMFRQTDTPAVAQKLVRYRRALAGSGYPRFARHIRTFLPDAVICTHYLPVEITADLRTRGLETLLACVVTDFEAHSLWIEPGVDLYCVATAQTRASLELRSVPDDRIKVTGIPIAAGFGRAPDQGAARRSLSLRDDQRVLLVLGGGFGLGPVMETLSAIDKIDLPFQVMVVTGRNEALRQQLATCDWRHATRVLGFVNHMPELMAAADLIVTKPGGLTASEALAVGRPLLLVNPIPGQEEANAGFLLERGAAAKVNRVEDLGFRVAELLDQRRLRRMTTAAHRLGKPDAAEVACRAIQARLAERPRITGLPRGRPAWLRPPSDGTPVS